MPQPGCMEPSHYETMGIGMKIGNENIALFHIFNHTCEMRGIHFLPVIVRNFYHTAIRTTMCMHHTEAWWLEATRELLSKNFCISSIYPNPSLPYSSTLHTSQMLIFCDSLFYNLGVSALTVSGVRNEGSFATWTRCGSVKLWDFQPQEAYDCCMPTLATLEEKCRI